MPKWHGVTRVGLRGTSLESPDVITGRGDCGTQGLGGGSVAAREECLLVVARTGIYRVSQREP